MLVGAQDHVRRTARPGRAAILDGTGLPLQFSTIPRPALKSTVLLARSLEMAVITLG
jgi:hypothetical protein